MAAKKKTSTVAKLDNGTIQITFTVPWKTIEEKRSEVAEKMAENATIPGFRKGKAPLDKAIKHLPQDQLTENTLSEILPKMFADVIKDEDLKPAIYPKFELLHAHEGEDWQIRATTCEIPSIEFKTEYKKALKSIKLDKKAAKEEKENAVIEKLVEIIDSSVPEMLVEEEVNSRLSSLLQRLESIGLSLENYLASIKKTAPELREEYSDQARKSIILDIALQEIAEKEKIEISDKEVDEYLKVVASSSQNKATFDDNQKRTVRLFLSKRKTLDHLVTLV